MNKNVVLLAIVVVVIVVAWVLSNNLTAGQVTGTAIRGNTIATAAGNAPPSIETRKDFGSLRSVAGGTQTTVNGFFTQAQPTQSVASFFNRYGQQPAR